MNEDSLFLRALASLPEQREAFLEHECGPDFELRDRIKARLQAYEADRGSQPEYQRTSDYAPGSGGDLQSTVDARPPTMAGLVIAGRYTLVEAIGEGGMGEVWIAKQTEPVIRRVAIKLIKAGMDSKMVLKRFNDERQALALMSHPNIAKVLDGGFTPDRRPFFVMELVNGLPLNKFCDNSKLDIRQRLELFVAICQAVQHAHQKGLVHRDLKPSNILVTIVDDKPVPKVIDFGVAKALGGSLTEESLCTQFGGVVGTLEYMAPEQAGATGIDVDTRADIYSLGVILYELLTGLRPLDYRRLAKAALNEMVRILREEEPSKPSTRLSTNESLPSLAALRHTAPKQLMAVLRGELDWVVMKCLEKDRGRRYETANALARDLQRFLADEPVEARPPATSYRIRKFYSRHKGAVLGSAIVLAALIGSAVISTSAAVMIWREKQNTEVERNKATENAEAAITVVQDLSTYIHAVEFSGSQATPSFAQRKQALDATLTSYNRLLALHPNDKDIRSNIARMNRYRANLSRFVNDTEAATTSYREALKQYGELASTYPDAKVYRENVAETSRDFGLFLNRLGQLNNAAAIIDQAVQAYEQLIRSNPTETMYQRRLANILIDRAELDFQFGRFPESEKVARSSAELYGQLKGSPGNRPEPLDALFQAMAENRVALALSEQGKVGEAVAVQDALIKQIAAQVKLTPTRDYQHAYHRFRTDRAWILSRVPDRRNEGVHDLDEAVLGWEKLATQFPDSPLYVQYQGIALMYRGQLNSQLGQRDARIRDLNSAAKILTGLVEKYKDILFYRYDLGRTYAAQCRFAAAPAEVSRTYLQAKTALGEALQRAPENVQFRRALEDLEAMNPAKQGP